MISQSTVALPRANPCTTFVVFIPLLFALAGCSGSVSPQGSASRSSTPIEAPAPVNGNRAIAPAADAHGANEAPELTGRTKVSIDNFSFRPDVLEITVGTKVVWVNADDVPHTVRSTKDLFRSEALDTDDEFEHLFSEPGTYEYYCGVHRHMEGKIIVK